MMNIFQAHLDLIESSISIAEMTPRVLELSPNAPAYFGEWKAECLTQMDPEILRDVVAGRARGDIDPVETLARITCPVLLMQADPDMGGILPDEFLAEVLPKTDNWTVVKIEGAGHNINREHPEKLLPVVLPWLEAQTRPTG